MKIDPHLLMGQLVEQYVKSIYDQIAWMHLSRSMSRYQNGLKYFDQKAIADIAATAFSFIEKRIDKFLTQYDENEKEVREDFNELKTWLRENKIADAVISAAYTTALADNKDDIKKMVAEANKLAKLLLDDCSKINYTGDNIAYLEYLRDQNATQVIAMFVSFD